MKLILLFLLLPIFAYAEPNPTTVGFDNGTIINIPSGLRECKYDADYCKKGWRIVDNQAVFPFVAQRAAADKLIQSWIDAAVREALGELPFCEDGELGISPQKCQQRCDSGELVISPATCN